jgi:hypothetical protein
MSAHSKTMEKISVNSQKLGSRTRRSGEVKLESSFTLSVANRTSEPFHVTAQGERTYQTSVHPLHHLLPQNVDLEARWKSAQTNARVQWFRNFTRRLQQAYLDPAVDDAAKSIRDTWWVLRDPCRIAHEDGVNVTDEIL